MFRQSMLILVKSAIGAVLIGSVGLCLAVLTKEWLWLGVVPLALLPLAWRLVVWQCFRVLVDERTLTVCTLDGWALRQWVVPLDTPDGFVLRQPLGVALLDLGELIINTNGRAMRIPWIARFSELKRLIHRPR